MERIWWRMTQENQETEYCERPGAQCSFSSWAGSKLVILRELSWSSREQWCPDPPSFPPFLLLLAGWGGMVQQKSLGPWGGNLEEDIDLQPEITAGKATHWRRLLRRTTWAIAGHAEVWEFETAPQPTWVTERVSCSRLQSHLALGLSLPWENLLLKLVWMGFHFLQQGISKEYFPQHNRKCENRNNGLCIFRKSLS